MVIKKTGIQLNITDRLIFQYFRDYAKNHQANHRTKIEVSADLFKFTKETKEIINRKRICVCVCVCVCVCSETLSNSFDKCKKVPQTSKDKLILKILKTLCGNYR